MNHARLDAIKYIWVALGVAMFGLFFSAGVADGLETGHVILGLAICIAGFLSTAVVWGRSGSDETNSLNMSEQEKVKRERIDEVLRDLSNEELYALKQRLTDGDIDDEMLYQRMTLSDDGEIVPMERR